GVNAFYLKKGRDEEINSPKIENLKNETALNPGVMADILKKIIKKYPAEKIAIFIKSEGMGWKQVMDDETIKYPAMKIGSLRRALENVSSSIGKKIDVLAFDASAMAMAEVGYELKDVVKYMIASEEYVGAKGFSYDKIFNDWRVVSNKIEPKEFARMIVEKAIGFGNERVVTLSAVDLEKAEDLANAINSFADIVLRKIKEKSKDVELIREKITVTQKFTDNPSDYHNYRDLMHFMKQIKEDEKIGKEVREKAENVIKVLENYVIANYNTNKYEGAHGVSIQLQYDTQIPSNYQLETLFGQYTLWDEMINELNKKEEEEF
ncbi:MAG: clostripain-related cysteine peptidase, partial [bacterium]